MLSKYKNWVLDDTTLIVYYLVEYIFWGLLGREWSTEISKYD